MFTDFREREGEGERKGETHQCEREISISMDPDWESNPQPFGVQDNAPIN